MGKLKGKSKSHLEGLIRKLRPCRVAVIGDVMLDHYVRGEVDRLSPEAPIQVLEVKNEFYVPGGAANVAAKAIELGAEVEIVGLIGKDLTAVQLKQQMSSHAQLIDSLVEDPERSTTLKTRYIAQNHQLLRVDREHRRNPEGSASRELIKAACLATSKADVVILEDYGKGVLSRDVISAVVDAAQLKGIPIVVDPCGRDYRRYEGSTVLTPNLKEASLAAELPINDPESLEAAARILVGQTGAALAITREAEGISLFQQDQTTSGVVHTHLPTMPVTVFDVTGAGDAVAASMALALASDISLEDACSLANLAGRAVVQQLGVGTISTSHLLTEVMNESDFRFEKVLDFHSAQKRVLDVKNKGKKVVFTNGCFDLLHYGHAHLLQFARNQGDYLVLGLNSDASIKRLKGPTRPYVEENQRAYMLSLYPFVDLIVIFEQDTPLELITEMKPDILVKGGDYTPDTVVGHEIVEGYGGKVAICPRLEGLSTTEIAQKINIQAR